MLSPQAKERFPAEPAQFIIEEVRSFARTSPANRMPFTRDHLIFDEPLVAFADGEDSIFAEYKTIIAPTHLTPREALAKACGKSSQDVAGRLSVISWILPVMAKTRESNRGETVVPSRSWAYTRWYGEKFNDALRGHVVAMLAGMGYLAVAPILQPYFKWFNNEKGAYSNWSERHVAYAAGLGTFSLSDGFITERGIAHRCGSVVTDLALPASSRLAETPYSNCLFYVNGKCRACIKRCPAGAITEEGHDKIRCGAYLFEDLGGVMEEYDVKVAGCGLCQTKVPCEFQNPIKKLKKKAD
ncbi:Epoxyqueuosine reductase [subsurface metagenome]